MTMTVVPDATALAKALDEALPRVLAIARAGGDPNAPVPGLTWTASQVGTHLTMALLAFSNSIQGIEQTMIFAEAQPGQTMPEYLSIVNDKALEMLGPKNLEEVALGLEAAHEAMTAAFASNPDLEAEVPTAWYGPGETRTVGTLMALAVTETLTHGYDLAGALGANKRFPGENAAPALATIMSQMLPGLVKPDISKDVSVAYEVRIEGGESFVIKIENGQAWTERVGDDVDCVLTMRPEVGLLLAFRRVPLRKAVLGGHSKASGRKPWLGFKFQTYFDNA